MNLRPIAAALVVLALGTLTACTTNRRPDAIPSMAPTPTATPTATPPAKSAEMVKAEQELARYVAIRNRAGATGNDALLSTVTGGSLLRARLFDQKINRLLKKPVPAITLADPIVGTTPGTAYPRRFVVDSQLKSNRDRVLGLAEQQSAGGPWLWTYSVDLGDGTTVPYLTDQRGKPFATGHALRPLTSADLGKLSLTPKAAVDKLAEGLSGSLSTLWGAFEVTGSADAYLDDWLPTLGASPGDGRPFLRTVPDPAAPPVGFWLGLGKGLVFATLRADYVYPIEPGKKTQWETGGAAALAIKNRFYTGSLTYTSQLQVVIGIPLRGQGKAEVLGIDAQIIGASGT